MKLISNVNEPLYYEFAVMKILLSFLILISFTKATARVFNFARETVAPYISVRGGPSRLGSEPYSWQTPDSYSGDRFNLNYGGGFGVSFRSSRFSLQIGTLLQTLNKVEAYKAFNDSGTELYSVDSEGLSYGGLLAFSYQFKQLATSHWYLTIGGGYQYSKFENSYTSSAAGQAAGVLTSTEILKSEQPFAMASVGTEFLLSGTTTISLELGYHYASGSGWSYGKGGSNFAGSYAQGDAVKLEDGSLMSTLWSYPYLQATFRFYIDKAR